MRRCSVRANAGYGCLCGHIPHKYLFHTSCSLRLIFQVLTATFKNKGNKRWLFSFEISWVLEATSAAYKLRRTFLLLVSPVKMSFSEKIWQVLFSWLFEAGPWVFYLFLLFCKFDILEVSLEWCNRNHPYTHCILRSLSVIFVIQHCLSWILSLYHYNSYATMYYIAFVLMLKNSTI